MIVIRDPPFCFVIFVLFWFWLARRCWWEIEAYNLIYHKDNESLVENNIKNKTDQLLLKHKPGNNIHELGKQQNEWITKICFYLSRILDLKSSNKHVDLQNLSIYYTWKI